MNQAELKKEVGVRASKLVHDGMIVGLGTGSTAYYLIEELGLRIKEENLKIIGVPTSRTTYEQAVKLGIPIKKLNEIDYLDLTIDGADEIDPWHNGIKGGGGALLLEKLIATYSKKYVWIVDQSKMVDFLGQFPLPVEVVPFGAQRLLKYFTEKNYHPTLRLRDGQKFITDSNNYIFDLHLERIHDPQKLAQELKLTTGVVEHGLFLNLVDTIFVGKDHDVEIIG